MKSEKFAVRLFFLFLSAVGILVMTWPLVWSVSSTGEVHVKHRKSSESEDQPKAHVEILEDSSNHVISTRVAMIEKHMGRSLVVDQNMPYIGFLKPGEWRKYSLPEGIGIGRGSRGKQKNKFGTKNKKNGKMLGKLVNEGTVLGNKDDPNQLFFDAAQEGGVRENFDAEGKEDGAAVRGDYGDEDGEEEKEDDKEDGAAGLDGDSFSSFA